jgi:hypothetical protein
MSAYVRNTSTSLEAAVGASAATLASALASTDQVGKDLYELVSNVAMWWAQGIADETFTANSGDTFVVAAQATGKLTITAHGLPTGFGPVRLTNSGGALPTGLLAATDYWVIAVDANTVQLATSLAHALAGTFIAVTDNGTGTQTLNPDLFTVAGGHNLVNGQAVVVSNSGGALPTGLSALTAYWVQVVSATQFRLYDTRAHALVASGATGLITISTNGTGTQTVTTTATAGSGSAYLPANTPIVVDGAYGPKVSVIQDSGGGKASVTQIYPVR